MVGIEDLNDRARSQVISFVVTPLRIGCLPHTRILVGFELPFTSTDICLAYNVYLFDSIRPKGFHV